VIKSTCDIHKRDAKWIEVKGGIFENLLICDVLTHYKSGSYLFSFIFSIQNSGVNYLFLYFDSNISVTIQNWIHVPMNFFYS
jgi:hypothetical protein